MLRNLCSVCLKQIKTFERNQRTTMPILISIYPIVEMKKDIIEYKHLMVLHLSQSIRICLTSQFDIITFVCIVDISTNMLQFD